jgi:hypothetical protein
VDEEDLPAAAELSNDRVADDAFVELRHVGPDREPVDRRRLDDGEIANARERHVERARDRRRRERQHVDRGAEGADALLVLHAEAMLLVDDEEPQIAELHVLLDHPMRTDDDVDPSARAAGDRLLDLGGGAEARQHIDRDRVAVETRLERLKVLLREDRRRDEHGHLLAAEHAQERRAHRDLGLPEADVAAHEPIHRLAVRHVRDDVVDRAQLAGRLLEGEARNELLIEWIRLRVGRAAVRLARGIDLEQLVRHREQRFLRLRLDALPRRAAELVERRRPAVGRDVALHDVDAIDRDVEPIAALVLEVEVVALGAGDLHVSKPAIGADAVVDVHDEVVGLELRERGEHVGGPLASAAPHLPSLAEDLGLGDDREPVAREPDAARELAHERERAASLHAERLLEGRVARRELDPVRAQERRQPIALRRAAGDDDEPLAFPLPQALRDRRERRVGRRARAQRDAVGGIRHGPEVVAREAFEALDLDAREGVEPAPPFRGTLVERLGGRMEAPFGVGRSRVRLDRLPRRLGGGFERARGLCPHERPVREEVGQRSERLVEVREEHLHAGQHEARSHRVHEIAAVLACERDVGGALVDRPRDVRSQPILRELAERQQQQVFDRVERPLRARVEDAHALDVVAEELEPHGPRIARREDVEDPAADGEVARILHERHAMVAPAHEPLGERVRRIVCP